MSVIIRTYRQHLRIVRSYPAAMMIVFAVSLLVLWVGYNKHHIMHAIGYLLAVWLGTFVTDVVVNLRPQVGIGFPIKKPGVKETGVILGCTLLGSVSLVLVMGKFWNAIHGFHRMALLLFYSLFTFPIVLALLYLLYFKYKPKELGVNLRYWYLPLLIHFVVGSITLAVAPERSHWRSTISGWGIAGLLFTGLINAALPEEFTRMLLQTRLGAALKDKELGFVLATSIWASMHIPTEIRHSKVTLWHAIASVWVMIPVGLLWGYITHRTKSLFPAIMVHGLNLWGLQNFG